MTKGLRESGSRKTRTFLYARIMLWLSVPLFILGVIFATVQLTNQLTTLNQLYRIRSEFAFKNIQDTLTTAFKNPNTFENLPRLQAFLEKLKGIYKVKELDIFNVLDNQPLFENRRDQWSSFDHHAIEDNLFQNQKNEKPSITVAIKKESKELIAYIPITGLTDHDIYIAKAAYPLGDLWSAFSSSRSTLFAILVVIILIGYAISQGLARSIVKPIRLLNEATRDIAHGGLGRHVEIRTGDEIQDLAETFNQMSDTLKEMQKKAIDSNPLTGLPGNRGILDELQRRILERQKFVMFHTDLDRFKVFNDHFGLAAGDKAIKKTAELLRKVLKERGAQDDFVGHQGGDDYVIITRPQKAKEIAEAICTSFKQEVVFHLYPKEDYDRGYTMQLDRRRQTETGEAVMVPFPLIAISLAGISNVKNDFADYSDCMARVAPIKKEVKKVIESSYIIKE